MIVNVVQVDAEGLVATEETVKVDIGDVTWETLVLRRVVHLGSLRPHSVAGLVEAAVPRHHKRPDVDIYSLRPKEQTVTYLV